MPKPFAPAKLRLRSPADLLATVPHMLGFVPADSVVAVCLHGARSRAGLVLRFDLPNPEYAALIAGEICQRVEIAEADGVFIAVFSPETKGDDGRPAHAALVDEIRAGLTVRLHEAVITDGRRWWSYSCPEPCCGGVDGLVIDLGTSGAMSVAAAYALNGRTVLPDRESLVSSVGLELSAEEVLAAEARIAAAIAEVSDLDRACRRTRVRHLALRLMEQCDDPRELPSDPDLAQLAALCTDVVVRDEVLALGPDAGRRERLMPVLHAAVRRVPPPYDAAVCTMFGMLAYADGSGVTAGVALDRALHTDPDYSLAGLISDALSRQVPPSMVEEVIRAAAGDLRHRDTAG
ncbi:MAG TPA: DUF4192 domain-containing protein [Mycobacteriales bacterium]|nr:DUF4192 domain-containing protein [Mycobacteriales bacterium]